MLASAPPPRSLLRAVETVNYIRDCMWQGGPEAGQERQKTAAQRGWGPAGLGAGYGAGSLVSQNKTHQLPGPRDLRVSTLLVCGRCVRPNTWEIKIREENDKGRERRIQRIEQVKVFLENKSSKQEPAEWRRGKQTIKSKRTSCRPGSQCQRID